MWRDFRFNTRRNIVSLVIVAGIAILCDFYLESLKPRKVLGFARNRSECALTDDAELLAWTLPRAARKIRFWILPNTRYYEATFEVNYDHYDEWIDETLQGNVQKVGIKDKLHDEEEVQHWSKQIPTLKGIDFRLISNKKNTIHIKAGEWVPPVTTSNFREFSAVFDQGRSEVHVYFFR